MRPLALLLILLLSLLPVTACAHPGDTDEDGGHFNTSTGEYHYHHGYPAHQHTNGQCPYDFDDQTGANSGPSGSSSGSSSSYDQSLRSFMTSGAALATPSPTPAPSASPVIDPENWLLYALLALAAAVCIILFAIGKYISLRREYKTYQAAHSSSVAHYQSQLKQAERDLEAADLKYTQLAKARRARYDALLSELRERGYDADTESIIAEMLEYPLTPDLSKGLVFVKRDLSDGLYHHHQYCISDLVLASKAAMLDVGLNACPCCDLTEQPSDSMVVVSRYRTEVYHRPGCTLCGPHTMEVPLSAALARGRRPCRACRPTRNIPDIWY